MPTLERPAEHWADVLLFSSLRTFNLFSFSFPPGPPVAVHFSFSAEVEFLHLCLKLKKKRGGGKLVKSSRT